MGLGHVGLSVCVGRGAHTGLIGEQAALCALADGRLDGIAEAAADNGLRLERILEDHGNGSGDIGDTGHQHYQTAQQENAGHDRDDLLGHRGQTLHAAQENDGADGHQHDAHHPSGNPEGGIHGGTDGVGLHHAAHEAQRQHNRHGKEAGQELAEAALERGGDVVHRAAADSAVRIHNAGLLGQRGFGVDGGHAEECDDPHPENSAGAAGKDGAGGTHDVAGTHLCGDGGGQGLEGAHTGLLLAALQGQVAEHSAHTFAEAAYLHEAGLNGIPQAHAYQQKHQNVIAEVFVDLTDDGKQYGFNCLHNVYSPFLTQKQSRCKAATPEKQGTRKPVRSLSFCLRDSAP